MFPFTPVLQASIAINFCHREGSCCSACHTVGRVYFGTKGNKGGPYYLFAKLRIIVQHGRSVQNLNSITNSAPHRIKHLRNKLIAGILISVPLVVTLTVLKIAYSTINNFSSPIFHSLGIHFPGAGVVTTLLLLLGLGFMATNV